MHTLKTFRITVAALLLSGSIAHAQEQSTQAAILQKLAEIDSRLNDLDKRLNDMDKRYEIRFAQIDERFNRVEDKIAAVNQRIDDKFNLIVALLGIIAAFLALPYAPKWLDRFKAKGESQRLQERIDQIKAQIEQLMGRPTN